MRIAVLIYSLSGGGAERVASYLIHYFCTLGIEVHVFLMNDCRAYTIHEKAQIHYLEKSKFEESGFKKLLKIPFLAYKYAKACKKRKITHSLSLMARPNFINGLSRYFGNSSKIIINERAFPSLQYGYPNIQSSINKWLTRKLFPTADLVIGNSKGNVKDLLENFEVPESKLALINNPIDLNRVHQAQPINNFYQPETLNLITVGRIDAGKNHRMLIEAIKEIPNVKLYIIGEGELRSALDAYVADLQLEDRVIFLGFQRDPFPFLKGADAFVFGSNHEGFPNVLLEAMACEIPIVSTNCKAGPSEIMEIETEFDNQIMESQYGYVVPVKNAELMRLGIESLQVKLTSGMQYKEALRKRAADFELEKIVEQYYQLIL